MFAKPGESIYTPGSTITATSTASPGYAGFWTSRAADIASGVFVRLARGRKRTRPWMRKSPPSIVSIVARIAARVSCCNCELKAARRARSACGVACSARACVRSTGVFGGSRRTRRTAFPSRRTCWIVVSRAGSLIVPGSATSRLSGPAKAGCISRRFSIWRAGASHVRAHRRRAGLPGTAQRVLATQTGTGTAITFGQRGAICKPGLPKAGRRIQGNDLHESPCQCVGQRPDGELFQDPESQANLPGPLRNASACIPRSAFSRLSPTRPR